MNRLFVPMLMGFSLTLSACEQREAPVPTTTESEEAEKAASETDKAREGSADQERSEFVAMAQKEIEELNTKLVELKDKAKVLSGEAKTRIDQQIQKLEKEQGKAGEKLEELKAATGEKWKELKADVLDAIEDFKESFQETKKGS